MADEEAEQESGSPGGDLLELRRLRKRLLELETGLRESAEPAVQAATEYCKQLCQVRPRSSPLPSPAPSGLREAADAGGQRGALPGGGVALSGGAGGGWPGAAVGRGRLGRAAPRSAGRAPA